MRDYRITIRSTVDGETNEIITFGSVGKEYGSTCVSYYDDETQSPTRIVIGRDNVSIIREGEINSVLTFEEGKTTDSAIRTAYGDIPLTLQTIGVGSAEWDGGVGVNLDYVTDLGGETSRFAISVRAERIN